MGSPKDVLKNAKGQSERLAMQSPSAKSRKRTMSTEPSAMAKRHRNESAGKSVLGLFTALAPSNA